jgi:hypothetical protein
LPRDDVIRLEIFFESPPRIQRRRARQARPERKETS